MLIIFNRLELRIRKVKKINYSSLESDVIQFYGELYSNKLDSTFVRMRNIVDELL